MKTFCLFSSIVNKVILVETICTLVSGHPWPDGESDSTCSNDSTSSTASTATSTLNWDDMNSVIDDFIRVYGIRYHMVVESDRKLRRATTSEAGIGLMYHAYVLKFVAYDDGGRSVLSSVIVKVPPQGKEREREERLLRYTKERYMYGQVLPAMYKSALGHYEKLSPEFYLYTESKILVIENLTEAGFYAGKGTLNNSFVCAQVFRSLARFHALSIPYLSEAAVAALDFITVADGSERLRSSPGRNPKAMLEKFTKHVKPYLSTYAQKKFKEMIANVRTIIENGYSSNANGFNVILHGDPNRTNVFFQLSADNTLVKCKFIDFQDSRLGSPAIDLINYLITSVQFELFAVYGGALIREYFDEFQRTTRTLNCDHKIRYDTEELRIDLRTYKMFFWYKLTFNAPLFWTDPHSVEGSAVDEDNYNFLWTSKQFVSTYIKWMEVILDW